ncbi:tetratricopeptide repeat protein [Ideonella sp. YS5]|uniref:tetratricopeptide repeat protein n=1 Tax=Ideonella sp. YS5 TaxID=3453714 RepID=UPI003EEBBA83
MACLGAAQTVRAEDPPTPPAEAASGPAANSGMDSTLFYDVLAAELEAQNGELGDAFGRMVSSARRSRDEGLFERAIELALAAKAGDKALAAAKLWRAALPDSGAALSTYLHLLVALNRPGELTEPLRAFIDKEPAVERPAAIAALPRFFASITDKQRALTLAEQVLSPYANAPGTRSAVHVALGRIALAADQTDAALNHARRALADDPAAPGPVLLALELAPKSTAGEVLVQGYLARQDALPPVRLAYARLLDQQHRIGEAAVQLRLVVAQQPDQAAAWLSLGAYSVDLHVPDEAVRALSRFLELAPSAMAAARDAAKEGEADEEKRDPRVLIDLAYQLLAEAEQQRGNTKAAFAWLDKVEPSRVDLSTLARRASLMAASGQLDQARALLRKAEARDQPDARARLLAEAALLRDQRQYAESYEMLVGALRKDPDDTVVMYELAMVADRLDRHDDMESLLRRIIALKPDDQQAHNALGYSLADRNVRLAEALSLLQRAATLAPHDPFIIDSLGWVQFRLGHNDEALKLLRRSHLARPHVEVAAHLGEVLWTMGQRDEALQVWREGQTREADNDVLQETLSRLKVKP